MLIKLLFVTSLVSLCLFSVVGVKLPSFFTKCRRSDPDPVIEKCIVKSANEAMPHLAGGNNVIHFPSLQPLKVPFIRADVGSGLKLNITNSEITGLENVQFYKVKVDWDAQRLDFYLTLDQYQVVGDYNITGRILILPIHGQGLINTTFVNLTTHFAFNYEFKDIKGKKYLIPTNSTYISTPGRAHFQLDNLFNGNELLSKEMNTFLDENWKEVNDDIGTRLADVIGEVLINIIRGFTSRIPFEDLFLK